MGRGGVEGQGGVGGRSDDKQTGVAVRRVPDADRASESTRSRAHEGDGLSALSEGMRCSGRARPLRGLAGRCLAHLRIRDPWSRQMGPPQAQACDVAPLRE
jgi:hypothetical protein